MDTLENELIDAMCQMPIIDAHEHLVQERQAIAEDADVFTRIFCHYSITNAIMAGLGKPPDGREIREWLKDTSVPLMERWTHFRESYAAIRDTGYARAARQAVTALYGIDDVTDENVEEVSERLQADNTEGLYHRILVDRCGITRVINQGGWNDGPGGMAVGVSWDFVGIFAWEAEQLEAFYHASCERNGGDFDCPSEWVRSVLEHLRTMGHVGLKIMGFPPSERIDDSTAERLFKMIEQGLTDEDAHSLGNWVGHRAIELAPEFDFVVAVHCGIIWCGGDFTTLAPDKLIPLIERYPDTVFDLYHGGIPWVRTIAVMANQYSNIVLNMCWTHQISPYMTEHMINEWIDLVSTSRIIAFGGDVVYPEKTLGALVVARENIARALAVRIRRGQMTTTRAIDTCRAWFHDNPERIYAL